jgi:hypothetical protein
MAGMVDSLHLVAVVVVRLNLAMVEMAEQVEREWQLLQPIFNMIERYVVLNADGGWLENTILWDGNTETWRPPEGTIVKLESEIDYQALPQKPEQ